ncbi:MAG: hypothetical protein WBW73_18555 [Rhodoplanes sp.]
MVSNSSAVSEALTEIDLLSFTKAWVASLVMRDIEAIRPHDPRDRRGFKRVVEVLDDEVNELISENAAARIILPLLTVANELRPSNTGAFEGFEAALRSLQLTFTSSSNPWYDDIEFPVSRTQAESFVSLLPDRQRELATAAAEAFVQGRMEDPLQTDVGR